jgi:hypothetical protein
MAISRAQLLKELLPGLNALFGLEYARYGKNTKRFTKLNLLSVLSKRKPSCLGSLPHQSKTKVLPSLMTMHRKLSQLDITTRPLHWDSR